MYILKSIQKFWKTVSICLLMFSCDEIEVPTVVILSPEADSYHSENFVVEVDATVQDGIAKVELYLNNVFVGADETSPYQYTVNIAGYAMGIYTLKAVAYANPGQTASKEISITIVKETLDKPLEFTATKGRYGNKIKLSWNKVAGGRQYEVYKMNNESLQYNKIATVDTNEFEDELIENPLTQYFYKVRAYNSEEEIGWFSEHDYGYSNGQPYDLITAFGREGTREDEFGMVVHLSYKNGELFLADDYRLRVVVFEKDGTFKRVQHSYNGYPIAPYFFGDKFLNIYSYTIMVQEGENVINSFTSDLIGIRQATIDDQNFIYVAASNSNQIGKYDMQGNLILKWGVEGDQPGQFNGSWGIAYYHDNIVVSNYFSKRVQFFTKNGEFIREWVFGDASGTFDLYVKDDFLYIACGTFVAKTDYTGLVVEKIYGQFEMGTGIAVDEENNIFISSPYERKIYVYRKNE